MTELEQMGKRAKEAARELAFAGDKKNQGLAAIANALFSRIILQNSIC